MRLNDEVGGAPRCVPLRAAPPGGLARTTLPGGALAEEDARLPARGAALV
jgi:hypothetical protein